MLIAPLDCDILRFSGQSVVLAICFYRLKMATAEFLKGLPSYNETNFTKFHTDNSSKTTVKRPSVYLSTTDHPTEQIITTEKTNILLRYLHLQFDKKNSLKKRDANRASMETPEETMIRKRARMETTDQESP